MLNVLARKLELFSALPPEDRDTLDELSVRTHVAGPARDLVREGEPATETFLILQGLACRYKTVRDGTRQILGLLLPGDLSDLHTFVATTADHSIMTISACTFARISSTRIVELLQRPALSRALWWSTLVEAAISREWIVNLGRRNAEQRLAHLFCELHLRLDSIGFAEGGKVALPLTQADLGDVAGLSNVHVNRTLQSLRRQNLIRFRTGQLEILDVDQLRKLCGFKSNYLHVASGAESYPLESSPRSARYA